jgi:hypothetical protein
MHMCIKPNWIYAHVHLASQDLAGPGPGPRAAGPGLGPGPDRAWDRPKAALGPGPG